MAHYFISDLHLNPDAPQLYEAFQGFVESQAADATQLTILGDFFDAWIGDDEDLPFYCNVIDTLKRYTDNGLNIDFCHGNRDFLIGERFSERTGVTLLEETHSIQMGKTSLLLMHGDSLCTSDTEYMTFRNQVRNPAWQAQILALPLEQRRIMAEQLRAESQSMNSNKAEDIMDVYPEEVDKYFEKHKMNILLHGHTHRPARHPHTKGERIVLGDWTNTAWYVRADENNIELIEFGI